MPEENTKIWDQFIILGKLLSKKMVLNVSPAKTEAHHIKILQTNQHLQNSESVESTESVSSP